MSTKFVATIACAIALILFIVASLNPLRKSPDNIRMSLLQATPIGSTAADVRRVLERTNRTISTEGTGFVKQEPGRPREVIGVASMSAKLGEYFEFPIPLPTSVEGYWGFDAAGRLIDVWVWKTTG